MKHQEIDWWCGRPVEIRDWDDELGDVTTWGWEAVHGHYNGQVWGVPGIVKYCKKDGEWIEWGDIMLNEEATMRRQKKRLLLAELVDGRTNLVEAIESDPTLLEKATTLNAGLQLLQAQRASASGGVRPVARLIILTGPSGQGKTALAHRFAESQKMELATGFSFTGGQVEVHTGGYRPDVHEIILLDNLSKENRPPYDWLCKLTDPGPMRADVSVKEKYGLTARLTPSYVICTSTTDPSTWWTGTNSFDRQLQRRIYKWLNYDDYTNTWVEIPTSPATWTREQQQAQDDALDLLAGQE